MKKMLFLLLAIALLATPVFAGDWATRTLHSAQTTTGTEATFSPAFPFKFLTCANVISGTTPTNVVITYSASLDKSTWFTLQAATYTATTSSTNVLTGTGGIWNHLKAAYTSRSNGDGTTAVTLKCLMAH